MLGKINGTPKNSPWRLFCVGQLLQYRGPALGAIGVILSEISSIANIFLVGMALFKNIVLEV